MPSRRRMSRSPSSSTSHHQPAHLTLTHMKIRHHGFRKRSSKAKEEVASNVIIAYITEPFKIIGSHIRTYSDCGHLNFSLHHARRCEAPFEEESCYPLFPSCTKKRQRQCDAPPRPEHLWSSNSKFLLSNDFLFVSLSCSYPIILRRDFLRNLLLHDCSRLQFYLANIKPDISLVYCTATFYLALLKILF